MSSFLLSRTISLITLLAIVSGCSHLIQQRNTTFRVAHYNIKELDTKKINQGSNNKQLKSAIEILKTISPDILSLNEIQFDQKNIPTHKETSTGLNLSKIASLFDPSLSHFSFNPANTGRLAKKQKSGAYLLTPADKRWKTYADPVNFGVFPGQY